MAWELMFFINGSVAVYCACVGKLTGKKYDSLQSFQELCGFIKHRDGEWKDPREFTEKDYDEWVATLPDDDGDSEIDPPVVYRNMKEFKECGKFSFGLLSEDAQAFLKEKYGYFAE